MTMVSKQKEALKTAIVGIFAIVIVSALLTAVNITGLANTILTFLTGFMAIGIVLAQLEGVF